MSTDAPTASTASAVAQALTALVDLLKTDDEQLRLQVALAIIDARRSGVV